METLAAEKKRTEINDLFPPPAAENDFATTNGNGRIPHSPAPQPNSARPKTTAAYCFWQLVKENYL